MVDPLPRPIVARGKKRGHPTPKRCFEDFWAAVCQRNARLPEAEAIQRGYRGMLAVLERTFYPNFVFKGRHRSTSSLERGALVDSQVSYYITRGAFPAGCDLDPYAQRVIDFLRESDYEPRAAQVRLYDEDTHIYTFADIVGVHKPTGKLFLAELKTGFDAGYRASCPPHSTMSHPLGDISGGTSLSNQHHLQLGMMADIAVRKYGVNPKWGGRAFVLLVNASGVTIRPLKAWYQQNKGDILDTLAKN